MNANSEHILTDLAEHQRKKERNREQAQEKIDDVMCSIRIWRDTVSEIPLKGTVEYSATDLSAQLHFLQNQLHKIKKLI